MINPVDMFVNSFFVLLLELKETKPTTPLAVGFEGMTHSKSNLGTEYIELSWEGQGLRMNILLTITNPTTD